MRRLVPLVLVVLWALTRSAVAAVPLELDLDDSIAPAVPAAVRHLVELELRTSLSDRASSAPTKVHVFGVPDSSLVRIEVEDAVTGKSLARTINRLALGQNGATRLVALAIVELLTASWAELDVNPRPEAVPSGLAPVDERSLAISTVHARDVARVQIGGLGMVDGLFGGSGVMAGGGVRLVPELPHHLSLPIDLLALHGTRSFSLGDVSTDALSLDLGLAYHQTWGRYGLRIGAQGRVGAVRFGGHEATTNVEARSVWGVFGGPLAMLSGEVAATHWLYVELLVEAGYVASPTTARVDANTLAYRGPFVGGALCIAVGAGK